MIKFTLNFMMVIPNSSQYQLKYTYQLQQGDKKHHTKHTTTHRKGTLIAKTSVFTEQDDRCGNFINKFAGS